MQPDKPGVKRKQIDDSDKNDKPKAKRPATGAKESEKEKLLSVNITIFKIFFSESVWVYDFY